MGENLFENLLISIEDEADKKFAIINISDKAQVIVKLLVKSKKSLKSIICEIRAQHVHYNIPV